MWVLAAADFDIWPLAYIAMVPLLWLVARAQTRRRAIACGWLTGLVTNVGGFYWLTGLLTRFGDFPRPVAVVALVALSAYQAIVFALFAAAVWRLRQISRARLGHPFPMVLVAPLCMVTFELLVPFLFPWYLAITQAWLPPVIQIAEFTGPLGVTALLVAINGAVYDAGFETATWRRRLAPVLAASGLLAVVLGFGYWRIGHIEARRAAAAGITVGLVQSNAPLESGADAALVAERAARELSDLQRVSAGLEQCGADLIIWNEAAYPYLLDRDAAGQVASDFAPDHPARIRRGFTVPAVIGALTQRPGELDKFNSALMLAPDGRVTAQFDKMHLLLFGEYTPGHDIAFIRDLLPDAAGQFTPGETITAFPLLRGGTEYRLGPMICYEDILPGIARGLGEYRPHLLVNITNDTWFGDTSEPWQHLALSVFRAVEMRRDMVRAASTGVSAFVTATGRVVATTEVVDPDASEPGMPAMPAQGLLAEVALIAGEHGLYSRFGDVFGYVCALLTFLGWLVWPRLRDSRPEPL